MKQILLATTVLSMASPCFSSENSKIDLATVTQQNHLELTLQDNKGNTETSLAPMNRTKISHRKLKNYIRNRNRIKDSPLFFTNTPKMSPLELDQYDEISFFLRDKLVYKIVPRKEFYITIERGEIRYLFAPIIISATFYAYALFMKCCLSFIDFWYDP